MTRVAACLRRARTLATLLIVLAVLITAVVLAPGCDRVVNLTPFFDAQPDRDSGLADGGFDLDALPEDGNAPRGDGSVFPDDGHSLPDDGSALPSDGGTTPTDGSATPSDGGPPPIDGSATSADDGAFPTMP